MIGYLYNPALLACPSDAETDQLLAAGASKVYVDWGSRIHLANVQDQILQGQISTLLLKRLEDLGDTVAAVHHWILQCQRLGVVIELVTAEGSKNLQTSQAWIEVLADLPRDLQRRRSLQSHVQKRLDLKPPPGRAPFGYRREPDRYVLDRKQAAIVKDFFEHFLLYGSLRASVRYLAQQHQKKISVATARQWLLNPVYRGDLRFADGTTIRNTHNPILSRQEAAQIDRWLKRNQGIPRRAASANRSLSGLVICQDCQQKLRIVQVTQQHRKHPYLYLRCQSCRYSLRYDLILDTVIHQICEQLPQRAAEFDPTPIATAKQQIETKLNQNEATLNQIADLRSQGVLSDQVAQQQCYQLKAEIAACLETLAQLPPPNLPEIAQTLSIKPFWQDLSESERRSYFREFIHSILVNPSGVISIQFFF